MNLKDIGSAALHVLKVVAPDLAAAATGPFAPLVLPILQRVLGTTDAVSTEAALLNATPDQLIEMKKENDNFQVQMTTLGINRDQLAFNDLANARSMQVANKDPTVGRLAWTMVLGFIGGSMIMIAGMIMYPVEIAQIPGAAWAMIGTLVGYLAKGATQAESFYFGSSAGSQAKDVTIADIAKQP